MLNGCALYLRVSVIILTPNYHLLPVNVYHDFVSFYVEPLPQLYGELQHYVVVNFLVEESFIVNQEARLLLV